MKRAFLVVTTIIILFSSSCNRQNSNSDEIEYSAINDSIEQWISKARQKSTEAEKRQALFSKATKEIEKIPIDTLKGARLSQLSYAYYTLKDSTNFRKINKRLLDFAQRTEDSIRLAEAYWDKGAFYNSANIAKRDSAYYHFALAQKIYSHLGDNLNSARVLRSMATVQTAIHDNTGAMVTLIAAIKLLKPLDDYGRLYEAYNTLGIAANALNEYDQALDYYNTALEYLDKTDKPEENYASFYNNMGYLYLTKKEYDKAKLYFIKALEQDSLFAKRPSTYAKVLDHLAMTNLYLGEKDNVGKNLYHALRIRDSIGDIEGLSLNYYNLSKYYQESGNTTDAFIYAQNSRDLAREINNNLRYMESLKLMAQLDPENAIAYNNEYIKISDSMQLEERQIRNKFERIRFETDEALAQNETLSRLNLLWISIAAGVFLFAVSLLIIVMQRIKNQRLRFQQQQQEANQEIFNLMLSQKQKLEEGKQTEQKRISEELHDGILGEMNGVRMILLGLNKKGDQSAIALREQAIEKLKEVQEEIRTISHELNDASYQKFNNFMISMEDLLKSVCGPAELHYHFTYDEDMDWDQLEGTTKINLYRIVQESLQNCVKHAQADTVFISFETNEKNIVVSIQDNGKGFDPTFGRKGIGHKNIKSRIEKLKGKWQLKSAPGIGTTVLLEIPLEHISQEAKKEISLPKDLQEA